jgi:hypothetical protein
MRQQPFSLLREENTAFKMTPSSAGADCPEINNTSPKTDFLPLSRSFHLTTSDEDFKVEVEN